MVEVKTTYKVFSSAFAFLTLRHVLEIFLVVLCSIFELVHIVIDVGQFLIYLVVVGLDFPDLIIHVDGHMRVDVFVHKGIELHGLGIFGLDVQNLLILLTCRSIVATCVGNFTGKEKSGNIGCVVGIDLAGAEIGQRIDFIIEEEITHADKLVVVLLDFLHHSLIEFVSLFRVAKLHIKDLLGQCLHVGGHWYGRIALVGLSVRGCDAHEEHCAHYQCFGKN